jgi:hypothetical protein
MVFKSPLAVPLNVCNLPGYALSPNSVHWQCLSDDSSLVLRRILVGAQVYETCFVSRHKAGLDRRRGLDYSQPRFINMTVTHITTCKPATRCKAMLGIEGVRPIVVSSLLGCIRHGSKKSHNELA